MKRVFIWALASALLLGLAGCDWFKPKPPEPTQPETTTQDEATTQEETTPAPQGITLYLPNENADGFDTKQAQTDGSIEDIVALLVAEGALPEGCAPLSFQPDDEVGARLDMNDAFRQAVSSTGTTGEYLRFGSLVNTVLKYYGLEQVYITAQGKVIESGHAIYDEPLRFYENQVAESY